VKQLPTNVFVGGNHNHVHLTTQVLEAPRLTSSAVPPPLYVTADYHQPTMWDRFEPLRWMLFEGTAYVFKVCGAITFKALHIGLIIGERTLGAGRHSLEQLALKSEWRVLRPCLPSSARKELPRDC